MPSRRTLISIGPSPSQLTPYPVNEGVWREIKTPLFEGRVCVYVKGYVDKEGNTVETPYFDVQGRKQVTWSMQVQGRMLEPIASGDLVVGFMFDKPLHLPFGFNPIMRFLRYINPWFEDGTSEARPWAMAPLGSTATFIQHTIVPVTQPLPPPPSPTCLIPESAHGLAPPECTPEELKNLHIPRKRRAVFTKRHADITMTPIDACLVELCYGRVSFPDFHLRLPMGIHLDAMKFIGDQPIMAVFCRKNPNGGPPREEDIMICTEVRVVN